MRGGVDTLYPEWRARGMTLSPPAAQSTLTPVYTDASTYLTQPWIVNYAFKKLPDGSKWNPTPCTVK